MSGAFEDYFAESEKFGVVGALAKLVDREHFTEDTLVVAGGNLISFDIVDILNAFQANDAQMLTTYEFGSYERAFS